MATNTAGSAARQDPRQVTNTMKGDISWNTTGASTGIKIGTLPTGAFITSVKVEVVTAFNAASTNVLTAGTNSTSFNDIVNSADVNEAAAGVTEVSRGWGRSLAASADKDVYMKFTETGTASTAGRAIMVIEYEGGWSS